MNSSLWHNLKENIQVRCNDAITKAWLEPLKFISFKNNELCLKVPSRIHKKYIEENALQKIKGACSSLYKESISVSIRVDKEDFLKEKPTVVFPKKTTFNPVSKPSKKNSFIKSFFNPNYTFSHFVSSKSNELAYVSCCRIAENPGAEKRLNPLFIHGPVGIGKTHLLHATGNEISRKYPHLNICYIPAERFMNEVISSILKQKMEPLRIFFRKEVDVLLLDDIQCLKGNHAPQEFFHTFNALIEKNRQIVVASDCSPRDIPEIGDRIKSRLEWGIITDIQTPEIEERWAIVKYKMKKINLVLEEKTIEYVAKVSRRSIREIEGNLNKIKIYSELTGKKPTLEMIKSQIKLKENLFTLSIESLQNIVAKHFNLKIDDLKSKSRYQNIVLPRQMAMYLIKKYIEKTCLKDIGKAFGGRDHTTVINSIKRIKKMKEESSQVKRDLTRLDTEIQNIMQGD